MDIECPSLVATWIWFSDNYLSQKSQSTSSYSWPFIKGGGRYLGRSCISRARSAYWRISTLKGFTMSLWMYLNWSWEVYLCFLHMLFTNLNHNSFSKWVHQLDLVIRSPDLSIASTVYQIHNCSMETPFPNPRIHWYPENTFVEYLHSSSTCRYFFSAGTLRMHFIYLILVSTSITDVISRCSNTPTVRSSIVIITESPSWSNVSM